MFACLADRMKGLGRYVSLEQDHATQGFRVLVDEELVGREGKRRYRLGAAADRE